jgi:hypothetical protein
MTMILLTTLYQLLTTYISLLDLILNKRSRINFTTSIDKQVFNKVKSERPWGISELVEIFSAFPISWERMFGRIKEHLRGKKELLTAEIAICILTLR